MTLQEKIDVALAALDRRTLEILASTAAKAHIAGDVRAHKLARLKIAFDVVQKEALNYAKAYKQQLIEKGGTDIVEVLDGKTVRTFKPWFAEASADQRKTVAEIIERGIAEGRPTGIVQGVRGGYPKGSIAADLRQYFDERKSHASTVARTETARIQSDAAKSRYIKADIDVEYRTARDGNERPSHAALEGRYKASEAPDIGEPNCRCVLIPVVDA